MTPWPLSVAFPLALAAGIALMLAFDACAAWYARGHPRFKYDALWPLQFGLYVAIGFLSMLAVLELRRVEVIGAITGFVEATAGWAIARRIAPRSVPAARGGKLVYVIAIVTIFAFGFSIAGALLFNFAFGMLLRSKGL